MKNTTSDKELERRLKISRTLTGIKRPPFTDEHRKKLGLAGLGRTPWNKGTRDLVRRRETLSRISKKYAQTPKGIYMAMKGNATRKCRELVARDVFVDWYVSQDKHCYYCGIPENGKRLSIDRKDNNVGYVLGNLALACSSCNSVKGGILTEQEMKIIGEIIMKKRWKN